MYVCVLCMLFLSGTPHGLPPRSTGQWLAASTARLRSTPLRTASCSLRLSLAHPLFSSPLGVHLFVFSLMCYTMPRLTWFVCSFLRSFVLLLPRAARRFGDFNARQLLFSRLLSPSLSVSFRSSVPAPTRAQDTRALLSFPRLRPFPVPIRRVSTVNRYFRSDAFRLSIGAPILHVKLACSLARFSLPRSFYK